MQRTFALLTVIASFLTSPLFGDVPWPSKTGPHSNGTLPGSADAIPLEWDEASGKNVAWKIPLIGVGHSTPVIGDGRVWFTSANANGTQQFVECIDATTGKTLHYVIFVSDTGVVTCVDATTGGQVWTGRIGGNQIASPLVVEDRVYFFSIEGESSVIDGSTDKLRIVARSVLDEGMRASPAATGNALYLRTHKHLYKIAQPLASR